MKKYLVLLSVAFFLFSCRTEPSANSAQTANANPSNLNIRLLSEPDGLSPILSRKGHSRKVFRHLYTRLLDVDPVSLASVPFLATSRAKVDELDNGNLTFTFDIHKNAAWSDGTPLTYHDLVFSYKILKHPNVRTRYSPIADLISNIEVDASNPHRITFVANECHITLETGIAEMFIYPEHIFDPQKAMRNVSFVDFKNQEKIDAHVKENEELATVAKRFTDPEYVRDPAKFVSSGPYLFEEWITGQRVKIKKNKDWWGQNLKGNLFVNKAEHITYQIIPDNTTALTQLSNGEIDAFSDVPAELFEEYKTKENIAPAVQSALTAVMLNLNTKSGLLSDKNVRQALALACDEKEILENVQNGYGELLTGPFRPGSKDYNEAVKPPSFQPKKAKALLEKSGWHDSDQDGILDKVINGRNTKLSVEYVTTPSSTTGALIGDLLKKSAKKAGIEIRINPKDSKVYSADLRAGNFDIVLQGTSTSIGLYDPKGKWHTESFPPNGSNYCRFGNEKSDAIIDQLRTECDDPGKRIALSHQLHAMIADEQPVIFLYKRPSLHLINKKYDNVVVSANRPGLYEEFLTLK